MLKACLLSALLCVFITSYSFARILRVNNNPGIAANYKTLDSAYYNAKEGDTLHLEGSATSYGSLTCSKKLTILGPGYFLAENPKTQALVATAIVDNMTFNNNSNFSVIMGLEFYGNLSINASDVTVKRNKFLHPYNNTPQYLEYIVSTLNVGTQSNGLPVTNTLISQNYGLSINVSSASSGIFIFNNYITLFGGYADYQNSFFLNANASAVVQNNIFKRGNVAASVNSTFSNNIMVTGTFDGAGTFVTNNIGNGTQFGTANSNKSSVDMNSVFVGPTGNSQDGQWKLKEGSPAKGAGFDSTPQNPVDAGIYSGPSPYVLSGMPPIPSIYFFTTTPVGSNATPLTVTVSVKSGG